MPKYVVLIETTLLVGANNREHLEKIIDGTIVPSLTDRAREIGANSHENINHLETEHTNDYEWAIED